MLPVSQKGASRLVAFQATASVCDCLTRSAQGPQTPKGAGEEAVAVSRDDRDRHFSAMLEYRLAGPFLSVPRGPVRAAQPFFWARVIDLEAAAT